MYRVKKALNHNAVVAIDAEKCQEFLILGKGIGFGKKVTEYVEPRAEDTVYSMKECTERGEAEDIVNEVSPVCLESADAVLNKAEEEFGNIDRRILFPLADHIEFAVKRIKNNEQIINPLTADIRVLFHSEYKVAEGIKPLLLEKMGVEIDEHEVGYIALHIHSAIDTENVSQSMIIAQGVRECISMVEAETGRKINVLSISYNRLMNHIKYMIARALKGEKIKLNLNDYMENKFPQEFQMAITICDNISHLLKLSFDESEIGYLAMHIQRVTSGELD